MASGTGATDTYFPPLNASKGSSCPQRASRKYFRTVTLLQSAAITYGVRARGLGRGKGKQSQCKGEAGGRETFGAAGPSGTQAAPRGRAGFPSGFQTGMEGIYPGLRLSVPRENEAGELEVSRPCARRVLPCPLHATWSRASGCRGGTGPCPAPLGRGKSWCSVRAERCGCSGLFGVGSVARISPHTPKAEGLGGMQVRVQAAGGTSPRPDPHPQLQPDPVPRGRSRGPTGEPLSGRLGWIWPEGNSIAQVIIPL